MTLTTESVTGDPYFQGGGHACARRKRYLSVRAELEPEPPRRSGVTKADPHRLARRIPRTRLRGQQRHHPTRKRPGRTHHLRSEHQAVTRRGLGTHACVVRGAGIFQPPHKTQRRGRRVSLPWQVPRGSDRHPHRRGNERSRGHARGEGRLPCQRPGSCQRSARSHPCRRHGGSRRLLHGRTYLGARLRRGRMGRRSVIRRSSRSSWNDRRTRCSYHGLPAGRRPAVPSRPSDQPATEGESLCQAPTATT